MQKLNNVMFIGRMSAGKTVAANYLVNTLGYKKFSLATPVKEVEQLLGSAENTALGVVNVCREMVNRGMIHHNLHGGDMLSLVEVLAASGILLMAIGAIFSLSYGTLSQEEITRKLARGYCFQENAAKLYYLGLEPEEIINLLPLDKRELELNLTNPYKVNINDVEIEAAFVSVQIKNSGRNLPLIEVYRPITKLD